MRAWSRSFRRVPAGVGAVTAIAVALALPTVARAQQSCAATTCPRGWTCQMVEVPCGNACRPGGAACEPCVPQQTVTCVPGTCSSDADCDANMVCAEYQTVDCPTAPPTTACPAGAPECASGGGTGATDIAAPCTQRSVRQCTPRWELPCRTAADCGAGFTCMEQQSCGCSGGGSTGTGVGDGGAGVPVDTTSGGGTSPKVALVPVAVDAGTPPDCTCTPSGIFACQAIITACTASAECPAGWSCRDNPSGTCWASSDGDSGCLPADPAKVCFPPYADVPGIGEGGGSRGKVTTTGGGATGGNDTSAPKSTGGSGACSLVGAAATPGGTELALALLAFGLTALRARRRR